MRKLLRLAYRLLIRNNFIRWTWLLALALYGVKIATDRGLAWRKTPASKTVFTLSPASVESFMVQNSDGEELTFSRNDSVWIGVKNNVSIQLQEDSVRLYLDLFSKMERLAIKTLDNTEGVSEAIQGRVFLFLKNNVKDSFSIYYTALDSASNEKLTFIKHGNERLLQGVRGDWQSVLNKNFDDFRNHTLLNFSVKEANELSFQSPMDTLNLFRKDSTWRTAFRRPFDPVLFKNHLENLAILRGPIFYDADRDLLVDRKIANRLIIKTPTDTAVITAFRMDKDFVVHSSCNPDNYFKMDSIAMIFFR